MPTFVRTQQIEHELGASGAFAVRITSGEVEIRGVDSGTADFRASFELRAGSDAEADELFERVQLRAVKSSGALDISEPKHGLDGGVGAIARLLGEGIDVTGVRIEADVPRAADLRFEGVSADVVAHGLIGLQRYRTVSGDVVLNEAAGDLRLRGVSGDVSVRAAGDLSLEASTVSGDLSVVAPRLLQLRAATVSGDVEIEGELGPGAAHHVETVSGDLWVGLTGGVSLEVRGLSTDVDVSLPHREEGARDRRRYVVGDGIPSMLFSSMSGDITVGAPRRSGRPAPPAPPAPPARPAPPSAPAPLIPRLDDAERMRILRAVESGEIGVAEAARRLGEG